MTPAEQVMHIFNDSALKGYDGDIGQWLMIEDVPVPDDSSGFDLLFRVEYRSDYLGQNARAWLLSNPVRPVHDFDYHRTHLRSDGFICVGHGLSEEASPYDLIYVIPRVRLWCGGYTVHQRQGYDAACRLVPGWGG